MCPLDYVGNAIVGDPSYTLAVCHVVMSAPPCVSSIIPFLVRPYNDSLQKSDFIPLVSENIIDIKCIFKKTKRLKGSNQKNDKKTSHIFGV